MREYEGYKNALKAIEEFLESDENPSSQDYRDISERLSRDGCYSLASHIIIYIKEIGYELQNLRGEEREEAE